MLVGINVRVRHHHHHHHQYPPINTRFTTIPFSVPTISAGGPSSLPLPKRPPRPRPGLRPPLPPNLPLPLIVSSVGISAVLCCCSVPHGIHSLIDQEVSVCQLSVPSNTTSTPQKLATTPQNQNTKHTTTQYRDINPYPTPWPKTKKSPRRQPRGRNRSDRSKW